MTIEDAPFPALGVGRQQLVAGADGGLAALLGPSLQDRDGRRVLLQDVDAEIIGIYFSGAYCPPCRMFTPILRTLYLTARSRKKSFEIVFCSADRSSSQYQAYRAEMPWLAIPFENRMNIDKACRHFGVTGIPCLRVVNRRGQECQKFKGNVTNLVRQRGEQFLQSLPDRPSAPGTGPLTILNANECGNLTYDAILAELDSAPLDEKQDAFKTIKTIVGNLLEHPDNAKYRVLKKSNKQIQKKLDNRAYIKLLKRAGFVEYEDRYEYRLSDANQPALQELDALVASLLLSMTMTQEPREPNLTPPHTEDPDKKKGASDGAVKDHDDEWVCDGDVCRRRPM